MTTTSMSYDILMNRTNCTCCKHPFIYLAIFITQDNYSLLTRIWNQATRIKNYKFQSKQSKARLFSFACAAFSKMNCCTSLPEDPFAPLQHASPSPLDVRAPELGTPAFCIPSMKEMVDVFGKNDLKEERRSALEGLFVSLD